MPLKGRDVFTFRFLWHANKMRLPYRILIADGEVNPAVARRLENSRAEFPALHIEHIRHPDDTGLTGFFTRMSDALARVQTPYAMVAANDDFLGPAGIERALDFLDENTDYICARGHHLTFSVYAGLHNSYGGIRGKLNRLYLHGDVTDVTADTAAERVRQGGMCSAVYYAVFRTEALLTIWRDIAEIDFTDLMLHESFFALKTVTLGKVHTDRTAITYYGQAETGISYQPTRDWAKHLLRSRFTSDAHALIKHIAVSAANGDSEASVIAEEVREMLTADFRSFLTTNYGLPARIKRGMHQKWPRLVRRLRSRPRFFSVRRERAAVLSQLKKAGATQKDLLRVRQELNVVESALSPEAFAEYTAPFLSMPDAPDFEANSRIKNPEGIV